MICIFLIAAGYSWGSREGYDGFCRQRDSAGSAGRAGAAPYGVPNGVRYARLMSATISPRRSAAPRSFSVVTLISLSALAAALVLVLFATMRTPLKDDIAWLLYVARKWMAGKQLYVDLVEINPPLIVWLSAIPAFFGESFGFPPRLAAMPFFAAIALACAWWTAQLLRGMAPLFARPVPIFAAIGIILLLIPGPELGQREHLLAAVSLPYLVVLARALQGMPVGRTEAFLSGIAAGLGCALKPRYGLAFAAVELLALARGLRPWRGQAMGAGVLLVLYAGLIVWLYPAYLERAVPLALALYGATDVSFTDLLWESRLMLFGAAALVLLALHAAATRANQRSLLAVLALYSAAAALVSVMDGKDWFYHRLPAMIAIALALAVWLGTELPRTWHAGGRALTPAALAGVVCFAFTAAAAQRIMPRLELAFDPEVSTEAKLQRLIKKERANSYVAFSEWIALGFPVVNETEVTWASRFDSMWALKGELWRAQFDPDTSREWPVRHWVARDFVAGCPDVVVADARGGPNYIGVLSASNAAFARAWKGYRQIAAFDGLIVYRRQAAGCGEVPPAEPEVAHTDPTETNGPQQAHGTQINGPINGPERPMLSRVIPGSR